MDKHRKNIGYKNQKNINWKKNKYNNKRIKSN